MRVTLGRFVVAALPLLVMGCQGCPQESTVALSRQNAEATPELPGQTAVNADDVSRQRSAEESTAESGVQPARDEIPKDSPIAEGTVGGDVAAGQGATLEVGVGAVEAAVSRARDLRNSAAADEAAGRPDAAYSTLLRAWRILRVHEGDPKAKESARQLRGDLGRLGKSLRSRMPDRDSLSNEKPMLVQ